MRLVVVETYGEDRLFVIGSSRDGDLLELIAVPVDGPVRIIHAMRLRPTNYRLLR